jgi:post-segregation antitoxin (ccd killing protein)
MRDPLVDPKAANQTVSITLNSDLYAKAKNEGINASKVAEEALSEAYADRRREILAAEIQQDIAAVGSYAEKHGSFADLVRQHLSREAKATKS